MGQLEMEEIRWWTRLLLICGIISVVLLISAPLGYRTGVTGLGPAFGSLALAVLGAAIVLVVSFVMVIVTTRKGLVDNRQQLVIAALFSLLPLLAAVPQYFKASSVPPIHDISTDLQEPPTFDAVLAARGEFSNDLNLEPAEAQQQQDAYPDVLPVTSDLSMEDAISRSGAVLEQMGLEVINVDVESGRVEAVATTFWFGFKDDFVVRVRGNSEGSRIDARSVSRVGQSDLGANAERVTSFIAIFNS
ncbi:MAG: hypothetical protein CMQ05_08000 [Gammaproteobacteria bacterium]|uniref:DUF1499 domain-containing protein n=1 Tax=OM182 bacterium MED-G24 TaxID=1986255 RepID=A0A2A5WHR9_9GAMM|nr:hypothetical protein [Gammaproteobacteria bacterium]PDH35818.1 MAG: hypothetical protein CNE99_10610 [OM182 bacterium MED-G24]RPG27576.1 MAG: DUF1499 domain-containing protein [Gammaproteobacteria bacterium TMED50]|tara:strand:- start:5 stop:745 length:741 start_codon:yes stop_codon:yes gene_type:complete